MRILLLADVHANLEALQAVLAAAAAVDACLFAGDVVDYGASPAECLELIRQHAWAAVKGNHDAAVAEGYTCGWYAPISSALRELHQHILARSELAFLAGLPLSQTLELGGARFHLVHARPTNPLQGYLMPDADQADLEREFSGVEADLLLLGHAHWPWCRRVGKLLVVNPGSVGQPRDGDPRAAYAVWHDGEVTLARAEYDLDAACRRLHALPIPVEDRMVLAQVLRQGG